MARRREAAEAVVPGIVEGKDGVCKTGSTDRS